LALHFKINLLDEWIEEFLPPSIALTVDVLPKEMIDEKIDQGK
jgi:hypothetical protein